VPKDGLQIKLIVPTLCATLQMPPPPSPCNQPAAIVRVAAGEQEGQDAMLTKGPLEVTASGLWPRHSFRASGSMRRRTASAFGAYGSSNDVSILVNLETDPMHLGLREVLYSCRRMHTHTL
jgi:hypothetical protein